MATILGFSYSPIIPLLHGGGFTQVTGLVDVQFGLGGTGQELIFPNKVFGVLYVKATG